MKACLSHSTVPYGWSRYLDLIDHRYFYQLGKRGSYSCDIARNAAAQQLDLFKADFADSNFLISLLYYIDNPSVTGFMIEQAVLSSIGSTGLAINAQIGESMDVRPLMKEPNFATNVTEKPVLYRPIEFNYKAIDGMIVKAGKKNANGKKPKLCLFPIQITVAKSHSDSHTKFFVEYNKWSRYLKDFDVEIQFLWINLKGGNTRQHRKTIQWPAHQERYVPLKKVSQEIWMTYQMAKGDPMN